MAADPFNDAAFVSRLQKLLSLLASEQEGEAEAARRKLLEHLAHARLSLTDVGNRLRDPQPVQSLSFSAGARELALQRELAIAREARHEAEAETARARRRVVELGMALQTANIDTSTAFRRLSRARTVAACGAGVAGIAVLVAALPFLRGAALHPRPQTASVPLASESADALAARAPGPTGRLGTVIVQDLPVRFAPSDDAGIRAFLNRNTRVLIVAQQHVAGGTWLMIRAGTDIGWVRASDVLH